MKSMGTTQRKLIALIALLTVLAWLFVIGDLARGGRPDPPLLRAAAILLDGRWQFHTGDDPRWINFHTDDKGWEVIDLTAKPGSHDGDVGLPDYVSGWTARGHPGYAGYAWYRRVVDVPEGRISWEILGPTLVDDGYELYWNGHLLGGSGRLGPHPRVVGTRPLRFALPADAAGTRGVLAVRVFALPQSTLVVDGGGLHNAPILAPRPVSNELHRVQWERTIAGYIVDVIEPLAMLSLVGLALWCLPRSSQRGFLIFVSLALALTAVRRLSDALVFWTDLVNLPSYSFLVTFMWVPTMAAWALAWNRWCERPWRIIDVSALTLMVTEIVGSVIGSTRVTSVSRIGSIALFVLIGARALRGRATILVVIALALTAFAGYSIELLDPIGIPGIWFPFGIGVSRTQYIYGFLIPILAIVIVQTLGSSNSSSSLKAAFPT